MSTTITQGTREWGSGGASPVLAADVSSSLLSHPSRPFHRLAADFNAAASPASASSPSLSDIRARLQDVMRTIDTTLDETANPAPLLHQHAPVVDVHRREYRAGPVSGAAAVITPPPPASSSASSACRSSSVASAASWSSRHRTDGESGLQSARPSAVTRDTALIPSFATHGAPSRSAQQDDWRRLSGGHGTMHDNTGHRPPIFGQRGKGHGSNSDEDSAATRGTTTASTGLSATYQARLDFWHPAAYHTLPHQNVARGEKSEGVAAGAAPAHSIVSALSSQTTASQYMRPTSRGQRSVGDVAGAAAAMMQGIGRPSNTITDTLTSTSVTTDRSSRSSSTASTAAEARRAAHATPQVAGHVPPRTASVPSALPSLPHPSTVPSLSARLAVLRAADAAQRSALQRPYDSAGSAHADPLGILSTAAEAAAVPAGLSSAASAPPPLLHHEVLASASCRSTRDAPALSPKLPPGAAPSCTRSPTRRPPATPTPATSPPPSRSRAVVYGINDSQNSDTIARSPDARHSSGAGAGAASPSSAERRSRRTTRQAETQRIVELALARQAAAEEAWRESEAHPSTTPTLLLQGNPQRHPPSHPRSASPALQDRSHTALITTAPLDALQTRLTRDGDKGRRSNASAGALAQEGELPMQEELAVRAMLAARRNREAASLSNGCGGVGDVESERRRMEDRGLGSGVHTPQESRFARFSQPNSKDAVQRRQSVNEAVSTAAAAAAAVAATRPPVSLPSSPSKAPETSELRAVRAHVEQLARLRERMVRADALPSQQLIKTPDCGRRKPVASTSASNAVGGLSSSSASSTLNIPDVAASAHASRPAGAPHRSPPTPQHRTPTGHQASLTAAAAVTLHGIEVEGDVQPSSRSSVSSGGGDGERDALLSSVSATSVDERAGTPERAAVVSPAGAKSNSAVRGGRRRVEPPSPRQEKTTRGGDALRDEMKGMRDDNGNDGRLDATQRPSSHPPPPPPRTAPQLQTNVEVGTASRAKAAGTPPRAHHRVSLPSQSAEPPSPLPVKPPTSSISPSSSLLPRQPRRDAAPNTRDAVGVLQVRDSLPVEDAERDIVSSASPSATRPMTTPPRKEAEEGEERCCASLTPELVAALQSVRLHVSPARGTAWQDPYIRQHHRRGSSSSSTSTSSIASAPSPPLSATPPLPLRSTTAAASAPSPPPPPSSSLSPTRGPSPPSQRSPPPPHHASGRALPVERSQAVDPLLLHQRAVRRDSNRHAVLRAQSMLMEHGVAVDVQLSGRRLPAVVKLSADATELLFYLERAAPAEAAAGTTPTRARQPSVALSPPPSGASSAVSAVAPARSASTGVAPPRFGQPSRTTAAPSSAAILLPHAGVRPPPPHVVLQQHAAHQRGSLYSVSPSVRALPPSAPTAPTPAAATAVAAPPRPARLVKVPAGLIMLPGRISTAENRAPPSGNVSPRFHTRPPPQFPPSAAAAAAVHPRTSPLSPSAAAAPARTQRRPSPAAPRGMHVRELHHFPCTFARVYVPFGVMGYETDCGMGGPHTWEEVGGMLCGPASFEVLRRYGCPLFAQMRGAAYAPYRVYVIIPEFRRIDVPQDAVLLVLDFKQRVDWVLFLLAMQRNAGGRRATDAAAAAHAVGAVGGDALSWEGGAAAAALHERANAPLLSYGRALWLLAVQRLQRARALRGLNPFESAVSNRSGSARQRSGANAAAVSPPSQRRGLLRGGGDGVGFEAEGREREGRESHPVAVWDAQVIRGAPQQRAPPRAVPTAATAAADAGAASLRFAAPKKATSPPLRSPRRGRLGGESGAVAAATHVPPSQPSALIRSPRPYTSPSVQLGQRQGSSNVPSGGVQVSSRMRQPERRAAAPAEGIAATAGRQPPNSGAASSVEESNGQQQQQPMYAEETSKPRFHWLRRVASSLQSSRRGSVSSRRRTASEKG